jgi:hypothetical protein
MTAPSEDRRMVEGVTLGELARRMDMLHTDLKELRSAVAERDDLATVTAGWQAALSGHEKQADLKWDAYDARVTALESWQTWAMRLVIGAVLSGVVALLLAVKA